MCRTAFALVALLVASSVSAQTKESGSVRGNVVDQDGHPIGQVQITLTPGTRGTTSNGAGDFDIRGLASGQYTLHARRIGFDSASFALNVQDNTTSLDIHLTSSAHALDSVRIRATAVRVSMRGQIKGKVVDGTGHGIEGAQVTLDPGGRRDFTDADGTFELWDAGRTKYKLAVRRIGYQPTSIDVDITSADVVAPTITMVAIPAALDSIRIRAKREGMRYSGIVLDQDNQPVVNADIVAMGINNKLVTDTAGGFTIPRLYTGSVAVRFRKIGYEPALISFRIVVDRTDTVRMKRLPQMLSPKEINERSGFGLDYWAYREMDMRLRWKQSGAGVISREELASQGTQDLCDALPRTPSGARLGLHNDPYCKTYPRGLKWMLIDGQGCQQHLLSDFHADEVEMIESYAGGGELSGSLASRCMRGKPTYVIWMRKRPGASP